MFYLCRLSANALRQGVLVTNKVQGSLRRIGFTVDIFTKPEILRQYIVKS